MWCLRCYGVPKAPGSMLYTEPMWCLGACCTEHMWGLMHLKSAVYGAYLDGRSVLSPSSCALQRQPTTTQQWASHCIAHENLSTRTLYTRSHGAHQGENLSTRTLYTRSHGAHHGTPWLYGSHTSVALCRLYPAQGFYSMAPMQIAPLMMQTAPRVSPMAHGNACCPDERSKRRT